eukprot:UN07548
MYIYIFMGGSIVFVFRSCRGGGGGGSLIVICTTTFMITIMFWRRRWLNVIYTGSFMIILVISGIIFRMFFSFRFELRDFCGCDTSIALVRDANVSDN